MYSLPFSMSTAYFVVVGSGVVLITLAHLENKRKLKINRTAVKFIGGAFGLYLFWKYVFSSIFMFM